MIEIEGKIISLSMSGKISKGTRLKALKIINILDGHYVEIFDYTDWGLIIIYSPNNCTIRIYNNPDTHSWIKSYGLEEEKEKEINKILDIKS